MASSRYQISECIWRGRFSTVSTAKDTTTGRDVVVKNLKLAARQGNRRPSWRDIKIMQEVRHENCLEFIDVFGSTADITLVSDLMTTDLDAILKNRDKIVLSPANVKSFILQTLKGVAHLHSLWIFHGDLRPKKLLLNGQGVLKITDFGLAELFGPPVLMPEHAVLTPCYLPPEILMTGVSYGYGADVWAVGCIIAELFLKEPFISGQSQLDHITKIFQLRGTPTEKTWRGVTQLARFPKVSDYPGIPLSNIIVEASSDLIDLLSSLLALHPFQRCNSTQALGMPYYNNLPPPENLSQIQLETVFGSQRELLKRKPNLEAQERLAQEHTPKKLRC